MATGIQIQAFRPEESERMTRMLAAIASRSTSRCGAACRHVWARARGRRDRGGGQPIMQAGPAAGAEEIEFGRGVTPPPLPLEFGRKVSVAQKERTLLCSQWSEGEG